MTLNVDPLRQLRPIREEELTGLAQAARSRQAVGSMLAYDVYRSGDALLIEFDVPGVGAEGVKVALEDRSLVVEVERRPVQGKGVDIIETGREHGDFSCRLLLGERWDIDGLRASVDSGVLTVRAPIAHQMGRRRVFVTDAQDAGSDRLGPGDELEGSFAATLSLTTPAA